MALDLVWLLRELDEAFDQGVTPSHLVPITDRSPPSVLGNANHHATATWTASSANLKPPAFTLPTQPPPIPPPPLSQNTCLPLGRTKAGRLLNPDHPRSTNMPLCMWNSSGMYLPGIYVQPLPYLQAPGTSCSGHTTNIFPSSKKESYTTFLGTSNPLPLKTTPDDTSTTQIPSEHKDHQPEDVETSNAEGSDDNDEDEGDNMVDTMSNVNP